MSTSVVFLNVPTTVNLTQFSDVQRGIIFIWFFTVFVITVITAVRLISGQADASREKYTDQHQNAVPSQSVENFQHDVLKSQITTDDDTGSVKMMKKIDKLNTMLMPVIITFPLNFVVGATYSFSLVLYFIVLIPLVLFNLLDLHKRAFDHKAFICIF